MFQQEIVERDREMEVIREEQGKIMNDDDEHT